MSENVWGATSALVPIRFTIDLHVDPELAGDQLRTNIEQAVLSSIGEVGITGMSLNMKVGEHQIDKRLLLPIERFVATTVTSDNKHKSMVTRIRNVCKRNNLRQLRDLLAVGKEAVRDIQTVIPGMIDTLETAIHAVDPAIVWEPDPSSTNMASVARMYASPGEVPILVLRDPFLPPSQYLNRVQSVLDMSVDELARAFSLKEGWVEVKPTRSDMQNALDLLGRARDFSHRFHMAQFEALGN